MIAFADLFCGAGGASTGVILAASRKGIDIKDGVAINHWPIAVETHSANHPKVRHLCEAIERVDPCEAVPSGRLDLLWASPECTHHSRARGGKPRQNQSRAGASHILTWLDKLYVRNVIIENVPEFLDWGPLDCHGQPMRSKRGENFRTFVESIRARSYNVEWKILNAADYGDATTRRRLFVICRRKPLKIVWPEPSHRSTEELTNELFGKKKRWKPAREIIDWTDLGTALSQRKRPLKPNTMRRIFAGLEKFCGLSFVTGQQSCASARSTEQPAPTIARDGAIGLVTPFLINLCHSKGNGGHSSVTNPVPTITTAKGGELALVSANGFLVSLAHGNTPGENVDRRALDPEQPLRTQHCANKFGVSRHHAVIQSFITKYYGTALAVSVEEPLDSVTTKDRFMLVNPKTNEALELEIYFRLLKPSELAGAHSFPADYRFSGNKTQVVKQIGNSNPVELTAALTAVVI